MAGHEQIGADPALPPENGVRLDVRGLEVRVGPAGPDVVSEVSFTVQAGQVLGLVGESGSGKTTVVLALLGHARRGLSISSGEVLVDGVDLLRLPAAQLRAVRGARVSYVPQDPSAALNPALRVGTQLNEAIRVHPGAVEDPGARIREVLQEAHLDASSDLLRRYPHQLSGGQQQRIGLAMAFACRPSLIVLDEPTTGLDVSTQRHVLDTIRSLCRAYGVAAVYVSHDLAVVGGLVSDVAAMCSDRIIEVGATARVFGDPLHPYTRGLLSAVPSPLQATRLTGIDGQPPRPGRRPPGCSFGPRCGFATANAGRSSPNRSSSTPAPCGACGWRRCGSRPPASPPRSPARRRAPAKCRSSRRGRCRPATGAGRCLPALLSMCPRSHASRWSASRARGKPPWPAVSSACIATGPATSSSRAHRWRRARGTGRGRSCGGCSTSSRTPIPRSIRARPSARSWRSHWSSTCGWGTGSGRSALPRRWRTCRWVPISCPGIRTSCPAASASASPSPARWSSSPTC